MDSAQVLARFEAERQALALMDHPAIATVFDGGTTVEGRPYFAMEYVKGEPITSYCDRFRLSTRARLELFAHVCEGVQHAHQKGVIHRDLKPSNVLVAVQDDHAAPKIIDFGVAKATSQSLTERSLFTELGVMIGTPEYMSPEQAELGALDIDTRTDIYALGVLLYSLLTGALPFDRENLRQAGLAEIQRVIREKEPQRPSTRITQAGSSSTDAARNRQTEPRRLASELRGDLDWITMRALEKDRTRRYQTANALAADVRRHLNNEPVTAGPPSALYRTGKLVRRHRGAFVGAALVLLALVAGVIGTSWAWLRAMRAEKQARQQAAIAEAVNAFLNRDLLAAVAPSARQGQGKDVTMREVLDAAARRIDDASKPGGRLADEPLVEAAIRTTLGSTYRDLGVLPAAEPHLERALELSRRAAGAGDVQVARAQAQLGMLYWRQGRHDEAEPLYRSSLATIKRVLGPEHSETLAYEMNLANLLRAQGRYSDAEPIYVHNLEAKRRVLGPDDQGTLDAMGNLANHYQETGRYEKAEKLHRQTLQGYRRSQGEKAPATVQAMNNLANDLGLLGRIEEAAPLMQRTLDLKIELYGADHPSTLNSVNNLAELSAQLGHDAEAERLHRQALEGRTRVLGPNHVRTIESMGLLATTLAVRGRLQEAERLAATSATTATTVLGEGHPVTLAAQESRARAFISLRRAAEAEAILRRQLAILDERKKRGEDAGEGDALADGLHVQLGMALAAQGRRAEAEPLLLEAIPRLPAHEAATRRAIQFLVRFYDDWTRAQPDAARTARAAEWQAKLEAGAAIAGR